MNTFLNPREEPDKLINDLKDAVETCINQFQKTELATENFQSVKSLCCQWEKVLSHGLKSSSFLLNVSDFVSGNNQSPTFFHFADRLHTSHEKERFRTLRHVWTDSGKGRALLRASLNERSLERYLLIWVSDENLSDFYESFAILQTFGNVLIQLARNLNNILFAITVDCPELNIPVKIDEKKVEPIINSQPPIKLVKKVNPIRRVILDDEDEPVIESDYGVSPKPLSSLCLKLEDKKNTGVSPVLERLIINQRQEQPQLHDFKQDGPTISNLVHPTTCHSKKDLDSNSNIQFDIEITSPDSGITEDTSEIHAIIVSNSDISSSSIPSSIASESNPNDLQTLREKLRAQELKNQELEERVNQLTIENHRLRMISANQRVGTFFTISISRAVQLRTQTSNHYAYEIHIIPTVGDEWTVLKRYREFYKLHCDLRKQNHFIKSLDFPPKKKIGNMDVEFVENRRQRLQVYLKHLLTLLPQLAGISTRSQLEQVFPFFKN